MIRWMRKELSHLPLDPSVLKKIELVSEEVLMNIIDHAYKGKEGDIDVTIQTADRQITVVIKDLGPPFDPLAAETKFDPSLPLEEREAGGLGIPIIRQFVDEASYQRIGNQNVLTLVKLY